MKPQCFPPLPSDPGAAASTIRAEAVAPTPPRLRLLTIACALACASLSLPAVPAMAQSKAPAPPPAPAAKPTKAQLAADLAAALQACSYDGSPVKFAPPDLSQGSGAEGTRVVAEIMKYTGLTRRPLFIPSVGNFRQGMLVQLPLHLDLLPGQPKASDLHDALAAHYRGSTWVSVEPPTDSGKLDALALNDTNKMELRVFANESYRQAVLIARLDNLGKGASGAAVQNLQLMLGI